MRVASAKVIVLALVAAMVLSLAAWGNGSGEKAAPTSVATIKVMVADGTAEQRTASKLDEQSNPYTDYLFAKTGVHVLLDRQDSSSYNDKVTLVLASGSPPDMISMGGNDAFAMNIARSGALAELTSALAKYPNLNKVYNADYWRQYSFDNKKIVLKGVQIAPLSARATLIRQDWLEKLNLKMPQTVNDLRTVAKAFVNAKLDGQTVFGLTGRSNFSYFYALSSAYGCPSPDVQMGYWYLDKAKRQIAFWNTTDAARAYFKEALRWNKEGLLDPELLSSTGGSFWNKINAGNIGIINHRAESVGWLSTSIRQAQKKAEPTLAVVPALKGTGFKNQFGKEGGYDPNLRGVGWGSNYKLTKIQAAVGIVQMKRLDDLISRRQRLARARTALLEGCPGLLLPREPAGYEGSFYLYSILVPTAWAGEKRDRLIKTLKEEYRVECVVANPPVHSTVPYITERTKGRSLPVSEEVGGRLFCPPIHPYMSDEDNALYRRGDLGGRPENRDPVGRAEDSAGNAHFWGMDEWVENGTPVPPSYPLSFARTDHELCFGRIQRELRMPLANMHFPTGRLADYSRTYDDFAARSCRAGRETSSTGHSMTPRHGRESTGPNRLHPPNTARLRRASYASIP